MKIMFYALRPFDEQQYCEPYKARYGIDYTGTPDVPRPDNPASGRGLRRRQHEPLRDTP